MTDEYPDILVCDDEKGHENRIRESLQETLEQIPGNFAEELEVGILEEPVAELNQIFDDLKYRKRESEDLSEIEVYDDNQNCENEDADSVRSIEKIDNSKIVIIDYTLEEATYASGEDLSYLVRCYSKADYIVEINQFSIDVKKFDLTLRDHPGSYADINLGEQELYQPSLWDPDWKNSQELPYVEPDQYRPWYWPSILLQHDKFMSKLSQLEGNLDKKIFDFLGFTEKGIEGLAHDAEEYLSTSKAPDEVTFREFAQDMAFKGKEVPINDESIRRVCASRLSTWLEFHILANQDILIDAPHLILKYPSLFQGEVENISSEDLNQLTDLKHKDQLPINHDQLVLNETLEQEDDESVDSYFDRSEWISRPVWFLDVIKDNDTIPEISDPFDAPDFSYVFCEDISAFRPRSDDLKKFESDVNSTSVGRWIYHLEEDELSEDEELKYEPRRRLAK